MRGALIVASFLLLLLLRAGSAAAAEPALLRPGDRNYLAFCIVVRNEAPYLREWLDYHVAAGGDAFYVYDHKSDPPVAQTLAEDVRGGRVVVERLDAASSIPAAALAAGERLQPTAAHACAATHGHKHTWMAFIDADEYLVSFDGRPLPQVLAPYEAYGALAVHWKLFGSARHNGTRRSDRRVLARFRRCAYDCHYKSVLRTMGRPPPLRTDNHRWALQNQSSSYAALTVNTLFQPLGPNLNLTCPQIASYAHTPPPAMDPRLFDVLFVHHYATKSAREFHAKVKRHVEGGRLGRFTNWQALSYYNNVDARVTEAPHCALPNATRRAAAAEAATRTH